MEYIDSIPFMFYRIRDYTEINSIVNKIYNNMNLLKEAKTRKNFYKIKEYTKIIIANMLVGHKANKCIAIPLGKPYYTSKRFKHYHISYTEFIFVLNYLQENLYIGKKTGFIDRESGKRFCSRFWALEKLYSNFTTLDSDEIEWCLPNNFVVLRDTNKDEVVFRNNDFTRKHQHSLELINTLYSKNNFNAFVLKNDKYSLVRMFPRLVSIFNRNSFLCGGRLFDRTCKGVSFQQMPKLERKSILINGESTCELDYSGLHIMMLYASKGIQFKGDPYFHPDTRYRSLIKIVVLILLNAKSELSALKALNEFKNNELKNSDNSTVYKDFLSDINFKDVMRYVRSAHIPIAEFFCSDCGLYLQKKDSEMALEIVLHFTNKNTPVLPVHDSFIIQSEYKEELMAVMNSVYKKYNNNFSCTIH